MNFLDLPEEIQLNVLCRISKRDLEQNVRTTCTKLYDITFESCLWRNVDLEKYRLEEPVHLEMLRKISEHVEKIVTWNGRLDNLMIIENELVTFSKLKTIKFYLNSENIEIVLSFLCRHLTVEDISLFGTRAEVNAVLRALSSKSDIKARHLHLSYTDEDETTEDFNALVDFIVQNTSLTSIAIQCDNLPDDVVRILCSSTNINLQKLCLRNCSCITRSVFDSCFLNSLVSLGLDNTNADDSALDKVAGSCPHLQFLSVAGCAMVTDVGFAHIASRCNNLRELVVNSLEMHSTDGRNITDHGLTLLAQGCPVLRSLIANKCPGVSSTGITEIAKHCSDLEEIQVAACLSVTDAGVIALAEFCPKLRIVNLNYCLQVTSEAVSKLVISCKRLHTLRLETCRFMSELKFDDIITNGQNRNGGKVENDKGANGMDMKLITTNSFKRTPLVSSNLCREIDVLNVNMDELNSGSERQHSDVVLCQKMSKDSNVTIKQGKKETTDNWFMDPRNAAMSECDDKVHQLNSIPPMSTSVNCFPSPVTKTRMAIHQSGTSSKRADDQSRVNVFSDQNAKETKHESNIELQKKDTSRDTDKHIRRNLAHSHSFSPQHSHLRVLHFAFSSSLTDASLRQVALHCPDLVNLSVRGCHSLSDAAVKFLLQRCIFIQTLDISGGSLVKATDLTDSCLFAIAEFSSNIRDLLVMKNDLITTLALRTVINKCRHLDSIRVSYGRNSDLTSDNLKIMSEKIPRRVTVAQESLGPKGGIVIQCVD